MKPSLRFLARAAVAGLLPGCISMPSGTEWLVIGFIALLLFGGSRLPGLMRSLGSGVHEFKKGLKEGEKEAAEEEEKEKKAKELGGGGS